MALKNFSTTPATNQIGTVPEFCPEGWAFSSVNGWGASLMADVRSLAASNTIASATTCDLGSLNETFLTITGTTGNTTITGFGTVSAGIYKLVRFADALTLTYNATSMILLTGASRTTAAGDCGLYKSEGSGNWREYFYSPFAGYQPLDATLTALAALDGSAGLVEQTGPDAFTKRGLSYIRLNTANGYGSTNTMIRRFTNIVANVGADITYADSAELGGSFTINTAGVYSVSFSDQFTDAGSVGISINSTELTTNVATISAATLLSVSTTDFVNRASNASATFYAAAGAVVRAHTSGLASGTIVNACQFTIARVS